jgi:hypothetical protein
MLLVSSYPGEKKRSVINRSLKKDSYSLRTSTEKSPGHKKGRR